MKKFISANEEIVHKQDAEIRRLASMIRRMDDDVHLGVPWCRGAFTPSMRVVSISQWILRQFGPSDRDAPRRPLRRKEYDSVINERDILGAQLIRRNDEIGLLQEKLKIQHSTLTRGEAIQCSGPRRPSTKVEDTGHAARGRRGFRWCATR